MWNAFILEMKDFSGLSPRWDFQFFIAIECWNFNFRAKHSLRNIDVKVQQNIILAAFEELMWSHIQDQEQTSVWTTVGSGTTLPCQTDLSPPIHTCGNLNFLFDRLAFKPTAVTDFAWGCNRLSTTITSWAGCGLYHLT